MDEQISMFGRHTVRTDLDEIWHRVDQCGKKYLYIDGKNTHQIRTHTKSIIFFTQILNGFTDLMINYDR